MAYSSAVYCGKAHAMYHFSWCCAHSLAAFTLQCDRLHHQLQNLLSPCAETLVRSPWLAATLTDSHVIHACQCAAVWGSAVATGTVWQIKPETLVFDPFQKKPAHPIFVSSSFLCNCHSNHPTSLTASTSISLQSTCPLRRIFRR